jgi:3,4-dihydroxy 2-butanone 4-phosphate synthase/GTP cyclohydrolase II
VDLRRYEVAAQVLLDLGVHSVRLMTNNPDKTRDLVEHGIAVSSREPIVVVPGPANVRYLRAKRDRLGHELGALDDEVGALAGDPGPAYAEPSVPDL